MTSTFEQSEIRRGSKVGRFVVVGELGSGGMGVVYAAHDRELDRHVALKVMRGVLGDDEDRVRMLREGQAMARVSHPNVITVFEVGTHGGIVFLAQELLDAGTLGSWLEQPRSEAEILDKFIAAGRGLAAAHAAGLVHRDFKPENVLLGKDGRVRVSDFGLARATGVLDGNQLETVRGGRSVEHSHAVSPMTNNLTRTGAVMGTPMFMAPEQHEGRRADERSDQFAFCVALYHALYGAWPFDGKTSVALADNVINGVMKPPPKTAKVSPRLRKILLRGLSTKPEDRYPSMDAMLAELTARPGGTRKRLVVAGVLLAAAAGAALFIATRRDTPAAVVEAPRPMPVIPQSELDPKSITYAIDHGTLESARREYARDAQLVQDPAKASIAHSAAALMSALRGELSAAEATLKEAEANKGAHPKAAGYADLAAAAIASARGELPTAAERSARCIELLASHDPIVTSMCHQIAGDTAADRGEPNTARQAYELGLALAKRVNDVERTSHLSLALAQLEFDALGEDTPIENVAKVQQEARKRGAVSCEANAAVLASRIRLAKADQQGALDVFDGIDPSALQAYRTQAFARIARGEVLGYRDEGADNGATGLDHIVDVRDEAKQKGVWPIVLEAELARVRVMLTTHKEGAEEARDELVKSATGRGYKRIATLARAYNAAPDPLPPEAPPVDAAGE